MTAAKPEVQCLNLGVPTNYVHVWESLTKSTSEFITNNYSQFSATQEYLPNVMQGLTWKYLITRGIYVIYLICEVSIDR